MIVIWMLLMLAVNACIAFAAYGVAHFVAALHIRSTWTETRRYSIWAGACAALAITAGRIAWLCWKEVT